MAWEAPLEFNQHRIGIGDSLQPPEFGYAIQPPLRRLLLETLPYRRRGVRRSGLLSGPQHHTGKRRCRRLGRGRSDLRRNATFGRSRRACREIFGGSSGLRCDGTPLSRAGRVAEGLRLPQGSRVWCAEGACTR